MSVELILNGDNLGELNFSDETISFAWLYAETNEDGYDYYVTSVDGLYFLYAKDDHQIWMYVKTDNSNLCFTFE